MTVSRVIIGMMLVALLGASACLSARANPRSYYVLFAGAHERVTEEPLIKGLVRVRDMDTDSVYEKFQIVVRKSPYQLSYSDLHVWAVKPHQMVSDYAASALESSALFSAVTRELRDTRPKYGLAGQLHAIEVYDSDDLWFVHLALSLYLTRFEDGERLWSMEYDQRKKVTSGDFGHAARGLSEMMQEVFDQAIEQLAELEIAGIVKGGRLPLRRKASPKLFLRPDVKPMEAEPPPPPPAPAAEDKNIYVPESPVPPPPEKQDQVP